jgi:acetolactate synthase-1/3 small subunit
MRHTLSVLVENKFGVLSRVAGLFSGRGYNIESLCVAPTMDPTVSQMTIVTTGDDAVIEQVCKQLNKLIDVIKVWDVTGKNYIDREMVMVRVTARKDNRDEILRIVQIFEGKVVDVGDNTITLEANGDETKMETLLNMLKPHGVRELVRTGRVAMIRANQKKA